LARHVNDAAEMRQHSHSSKSMGIDDVSVSIHWRYSFAGLFAINLNFKSFLDFKFPSCMKVNNIF